MINMIFLDKFLGVMISEKMYNQVEEMAESCNTTKSKYVRHLLDEAWDDYVKNGQ